MRGLQLLIATVLMALTSTETKAERSLLGESCTVTLEGEGWTDAEAWAWEGICTYGFADLRDFSGDDLECNPAKIIEVAPKERMISARFLRMIITQERYRDAMAVPEVSLQCAQINGQLDLRSLGIPMQLGFYESYFPEQLMLSNAKLERDLILQSTTFDKEILIDGAQLGRDLSASGVSVRGGLSFVAARIGGDLVLSNGSLAEGGIQGHSAIVEGSMFLGQNSVFKSEVNLQGILVGGDVDLDSGSIFEGEFSIRGARIGRILSANSSEFRSDFTAFQAEVGDGVYLNGGAVFHGEVLFSGSRVEKQFAIVGSTVFNGSFSADSLEIGNDLLIGRGARFNGPVNFLSAMIGNSVILTGDLRFSEGFTGRGLAVGGDLTIGGQSVFVGEVNLDGSSVGRTLGTSDGTVFQNALSARGARVNGSLSLGPGSGFKGDVLLVGAEIGGSLELSGSSFDALIDLTGARVANELLVSSPELGRPAWGEKAQVVLRNATVGALQSEIEAWQRGDARIHIDMSGFEYEKIGGLGVEGLSANGTNLADATESQLISWIEARPMAGDRNSTHDEFYSPQPYTALANALDKAGADQTARAIRYAKYEHQRHSGNVSEWQKLGLMTSKVFIGYGVYPFRILYWFIGLVVLGAIVSHFSKCDVLRGLTAKLWFSTENAFPLIEPRDRFKNLDHCNPYVESFFHLQKLLGFILTTILVGALTLLGG
jgi:hypothetical protein